MIEYLDRISQRAITSIRSLYRDRRGNVTLATALMVVPLTVGIGMTIDYDRMSRGRNSVQQALDAATLASAATGQLDTTLSTAVFNANFKTADSTVSGLSFTLSGDNIIGSATVAIATTFAGVAGIQTMTVTAKSTAARRPQRLVSATFKSTSAQGAYAKDIFLFTRNAAGTITTKTNVLTYRYSPANGGTKTLSPAAGVTKTIPVGAYETYGVGLVIYEDLTYTGKLTNPVTKYSDASNASTFIRTSGSCSGSAGQTVNVEDGGDSNFLDFIYNMTCTMGTSTADAVRLAQ